MVNLEEITPEMVNPGELNPGEITPEMVNPGELNPGEITPAMLNPGENEIMPVNPGEIIPAMVNPVEVMRAMGIVLPEDVIFKILSFLPLKSLIRFRIVKKSWSDQINNPSFLCNQIAYQGNTLNFLLGSGWGVTDNLYTLAYNPSKPSLYENPCNLGSPLLENCCYWIASCNGLVCLEHDKGLYIFNPTTYEIKQFKHAPRLKDEKEFDQNDYRFSYDPVTCDYTVVRLGIKSHVIQLWTLNSNEWKLISFQPPPTLGWDEMLGFVGVFAYGKLYWVDLEHAEFLYSFHISAAQLCDDIPLPRELVGSEMKLFNSGFMTRFRLNVLNEYPCLLDSVTLSSIRFWLLKSQGGVFVWQEFYFNIRLREISATSELWVKDFSGFRIMIFIEDPFVSRKLLQHILIHDSEQNYLRIISIRALYSGFSVQGMYRRSRVSLHSGRYMSTEEITPFEG